MQLSDDLLWRLTASPKFASGGIVQPAQDSDSVPAMLDSGCVFFIRTEEDQQSGQD